MTRVSGARPAVPAAGATTELGEIAVSLQEEPEETPLQVRLRVFSRTLIWLVVGVAAAILLTGLVTGRPFLEMVRFSIVLAMAAVPERLFIAVTVVLMLGMRKILRRSGLVKKLLAVKALGSVTVIFTDKTGTLAIDSRRTSIVQMLAFSTAGVPRPSQAGPSRTSVHGRSRAG